MKRSKNASRPPLKKRSSAACLAHRRSSSARKCTSARIAWTLLPKPWRVSGLLAFQQKGHRPVIDQMHLHIGTELASGDLRVFAASLGDQQVEQLCAQCRWCGTGKAWPQAALGVGGQGELRHQQQAAATIAE